MQVEGHSYLHRSVLKGDLVGVLELLGLGCNPNCRNWDGDSPLHISARLGMNRIVVELLKARAWIEVRNNLGQTPLHAAVLGGKTRTVELFLKAGANRNAVDYLCKSVLYVACVDKVWKIVILLRLYGALPACEYEVEMLKWSMRMCDRKVELLNKKLKEREQEN